MACVDKCVHLSDGAKLCVRVLGSEDTKRPLLIALHGAPGASSHVETEAAYGLLAGRVRVLVYDARGSSGSDLAGPFSDELWIADVDEVRWAGCSRVRARRHYLLTWGREVCPRGRVLRRLGSSRVRLAVPGPPLRSDPPRHMGLRAQGHAPDPRRDHDVYSCR